MAWGRVKQVFPGNSLAAVCAPKVQCLSVPVRAVLAAQAPVTCEVLGAVRALIREFNDLDCTDLIPAELRERHADISRYVGTAESTGPVRSAEWVLLQDAVKAWGYSVVPCGTLNADSGDTWVCCHADRYVYGFESEAEAWLGAMAIHQGLLARYAEALADAHFARFPKEAPKPEDVDDLIKEANRKAREALEGYVAYLPKPAAQG